jgi:hypothetical protein
MPSTRLADRVLAHCRSMVEHEIVAFLDEQASEEPAYAVGVLIGDEREPDWLAPEEVRVGSVRRRDQLLHEFPDAGPEVVWNVAELDLADAVPLADQMEAQLREAETAVSLELSDRYGFRAAEIYDRQFEIALREVTWQRWFRLTDDFVVFTWYGGYGPQGDPARARARAAAVRDRPRVRGRGRRYRRGRHAHRARRPRRRPVAHRVRALRPLPRRVVRPLPERLVHGDVRRADRHGLGERQLAAGVAARRPASSPRDQAARC